MNTALLLALSLHPCLAALPGGAATLRLPAPSWDAQPAPSLLDDAPPEPEHLLAADLFEAAADNLHDFADSFAPAPGGGDGAGPIAALAFVLGVIPGFGIGHLVAGSIGGFIAWLIIDVVVGVLLFYVFPVLLFPAFAYIWTIDIVVLVIERLIEGYSAYRTAVATGGVAIECPPAFDGAPRYAMPNLLSLRF